MLYSKYYMFINCVIYIQFLKYLHADSNHLSSLHRGPPVEKDILSYFNTLETAINYYYKEQTEVDTNLAYGLFLSNAHLKRVLIDKKENLPYEIATKIKNIIHKSVELLNYYKKNSNDLNLISREFSQISKLFTNSTQWVNRLHKLVYREQETYSLKKLKNKYTSWQNYLEAVDDPYRWIPDPYLSDKCLVSLSISPNNAKEKLSWCPVANSCYTMLKNGTDFGYALQHRLVLLQMAHYARGCVILSPKEDRDLMSSFCSKAYAEAQYIALNNYANGDLILEIICLCSLDGRAEFLQRTWLQRLAQFQLSLGCFGTTVSPGSKKKYGAYLYNIIGRRNSWQEQCNSHTTALAFGTYSAAIRYIIQENY